MSPHSLHRRLITTLCVTIYRLNEDGYARLFHIVSSGAQHLLFQLMPFNVLFGHRFPSLPMLLKLLPFIQYPISIITNAVWHLVDVRLVYYIFMPIFTHSSNNTPKKNKEKALSTPCASIFNKSCFNFCYKPLLVDVLVLWGKATRVLLHYLTYRLQLSTWDLVSQQFILTISIWTSLLSQIVRIPTTVFPFLAKHSLKILFFKIEAKTTFWLIQLFGLINSRTKLKYYF